MPELPGGDLSSPSVGSSRLEQLPAELQIMILKQLKNTSGSPGSSLCNIAMTNSHLYQTAVEEIYTNVNIASPKMLTRYCKCFKRYIACLSLPMKSSQPSEDHLNSSKRALSSTWLYDRTSPFHLTKNIAVDFIPSKECLTHLAATSVFAKIIRRRIEKSLHCPYITRHDTLNTISMDRDRLMNIVEGFKYDVNAGNYQQQGEIFETRELILKQLEETTSTLECSIAPALGYRGHRTSWILELFRPSKLVISFAHSQTTLVLSYLDSNDLSEPHKPAQSRSLALIDEIWIHLKDSGNTRSSEGEPAREGLPPKFVKNEWNTILRSGLRELLDNEQGDLNEEFPELARMVPCLITGSDYETVHDMIRKLSETTSNKVSRSTNKDKDVTSLNRWQPRCLEVFYSANPDEKVRDEWKRLV